MMTSTCDATALFFVEVPEVSLEVVSKGAFYMVAIGIILHNSQNMLCLLKQFLIFMGIPCGLFECLSAVVGCIHNLDILLSGSCLSHL